jgi:adenine deaminase
MLPSCVPATSFEKGGAELFAEDLEQFIGHPRVLGLAEVMDYPTIMNMSTQMMDKIQLAHRNQLPIDGHCAGLSINEINAYAYAGILTDHESTTPGDVLMRTQLGMYVALREGSAARNLKDLLPAVTEKNAHRCMYCTDDKHLDDIVIEGSIDFCIRTAIQHGIDPLTAYSMATLHPAQCYNLNQKGAIAPGYEAHLVFLSNLEDVTVSDVFIQDRYYVKDGVISENIEATNKTDEIGSKVNLYDYSSKDFELLVDKESKVNIIEINPNSIVTNHLVKEIENIDSPYIPSIKDEECKIAVIDRYQGMKEIGIGILKGLGLVSGAIATTIAHDSHQLIVAGLNDEDMLLATKTINEIGGGIVIVNDGKVIASLGLSIGGLMSEDSAEEVIKKLSQIDEALLSIRPINTFNSLLTLSFLALPVIPSLKMTTKGLFNVLNMSLHPVFEK